MVIYPVALFTRAWIEINYALKSTLRCVVALFTRAWIEINLNTVKRCYQHGRPLYEGVD